MCTGIKLIAKNNSIVYARTLEFGVDLNSDIIIIPRNYSFAGIGPENKSGLKWVSKYAAIGTNANNIIDLVDGVNEKGLAGGLFYFPDYAEFQEISDQDTAKAIAPWQLLTWILSNFESVDEVKTHLPNIKVSKAIFSSWDIIPPIHVIIHDINGKSLVIEYIKEHLVLSDNPIGVFTNAPSFDWHITNLRNYINLHAFNIEERDLFNIKLKPLGQGSGMLGLPGDFTSPSRFIRATAYQSSIVNIPDENEGIKTAFHILNLFDVPYGSVRQRKDGEIRYEYTEWTSAIDLSNKKYYIHTFNNRNIRSFDLMSMDLDSKEVVRISID